MYAEYKYSIRLFFQLFLAFSAFYVLQIYYGYPVFYDAGVYMYGGIEIANGFIPYKDYWDHKGFILHLYNAIGHVLVAGSFRGIFLLELILVCAASAYAVDKFKNVTGKKIPFYIVTLFVASYGMIFEGGDLPETLIIPFQLVLYSNLIEFLKDRPQKMRWKTILFFSLGVTIPLFSRPNNGLGIYFAYAFVLFFASSRDRKYLVTLTLAFIAVPLIYLWQNNALSDFVSQYIYYNIYYSKLVGVKRFVNSLNYTLLVLLLPISISVYYEAMRFSVSNGWKSLLNRVSSVWPLFLIFILDYFSQLVSGRFGVGYMHYAVTVLPGLFLIAAFISNLNSSEPKKFVTTIAFSIWSIIVVAINYGFYSNRYTNDVYVSKLKAIVANNTLKKDPIYISWGDAWLYAVLERSSFSKFYYAIPLLHSGYDSKDQIEEFKNEFFANPPRIIVDWDGFLTNDKTSVAFQRSMINKYTLIETNPKFKVYLYDLHAGE